MAQKFTPQEFREVKRLQRSYADQTGERMIASIQKHVHRSTRTIERAVKSRYWTDYKLLVKKETAGIVARRAEKRGESTLVSATFGETNQPQDTIFPDQPTRYQKHLKRKLVRRELMLWFLATVMAVVIIGLFVEWVRTT